MTKKSSHKSLATTKPAALATPTGIAVSLPDSAGEGSKVLELATRIAETLDGLHGASPGEVRAACVAVEADLLRLGVRATNLRGTIAALSNAAHMAELSDMANEVRS